MLISRFSVSQDEYARMKDWLLNNYPVEAVFLDEINKTVNELLQRFGLASLNTGEVKNLLVTVTKRQETDFPEMGVNSTATALFLAGMSRAISNIVLTEILPKIMPETKKCKKCDASNNKVVNYCFQCGEKFDDK